MATIVLGAVGAGVGAAFGNPMLGWAIGTSLAGMLFPPRLQPQQRGKLDSLRTPGSSYGVPIPIVYGETRVAGNLIWTRKIRRTKKEREHDAGKGGGSVTEVIYNYYINMAVAICAGPIPGIRRIWGEDTVIYNSQKSPTSQYDIRLYLGDETQEPDPLIEAHQGAAPAYRGLAYAVFEDFHLKRFGNRIPALFFDIEAPSPALTVGDVLADLFGKCGLDSAEYDVASATPEIGGFVAANRQEARSLIDPLLRVYNVDLLEADGKLIARDAGTGANGTLESADLGADFWTAGQDDSVRTMEYRHVSEIELPYEVDLTYFSPTAWYDQAEQHAIRPTKLHLQERLTISTPLTMSDAAARLAAERILYEEWSRRIQASTQVPFGSYLQYTPGDVLAHTTSDGRELLFKIVQMDVSLFGPLALSLVRYRPENYDQEAAPGIIPNPVDDEDLIDSSETTLIAWNSNAIRDADANTLGLYLAATGQGDWPGCAVFISRDEGESYQVLETLEDPAAIGETLSVLDAPDPETTGLIDAVSTVDVEVLPDEAVEGAALEGCSEAEMLAGTNAAILGDEIIGFQSVEDLGSDQYRLSNLLRGRRGTDAYWADHVTGERFVLLSGGAVKRVDFPEALIGKDVLLRPVTIGADIADASDQPATLTGLEFKPYSPVDIAGERDGSDNLTITWKRRARLDFEFRDGDDIPLGEAVEAYEVDILDSGVTVRTIEVLEEEAEYTAAEQTNDFGAPQPAVDVVIYQIGKYERGYPGEATI
jgi:hypothetical protein